MQSFVIAGECATEHRLMNEVDAELRHMTAGNVTDVVAELIFLLITQVRKQCNRRGELIVAEGFEAGDGQRCGAKRKCQCKAEVRVACLGEVQLAGSENKRA